jgi:phage terminase large subunit GpA-like protein
MSDKDSITITWTIDDVRTLDDEITTKQARAVLVRAGRDRRGISWETLNEALDVLVYQKRA